MTSKVSEATAWAFAVGTYLGLKPADIILDDQYEGEGAAVRLMLKARQYAGIHGLAAAGFCVTRPALAEVYGLPAYPLLAKWLQPDLSKNA